MIQRIRTDRIDQNVETEWILLDVALGLPLNGVLDAEKLFDTLVTECCV